MFSPGECSVFPGWLRAQRTLPGHWPCDCEGPVEMWETHTFRSKYIVQIPKRKAKGRPSINQDMGSCSITFYPGV